MGITSRAVHTLSLFLLLTMSSTIRAGEPVKQNWPDGSQGPDGAWTGGPGASKRSATALVLLAYLGAGETHKHGSHKSEVRAGLKWLKSIQDPDGSFAPADSPRFVREQALCTLAFAEAYALTASPLFKVSAHSGLARLAALRTPCSGWGPEGPTSPPDMETTVLAGMAFKSARAARLKTPGNLGPELIAFVDTLTDRKTGMTSPGAGEPPDLRSTAMAVHLRILWGCDPRRNQGVIDGTRVLLKNLPIWDEQREGAIDPLTWYYGTLALFQVGGEPWKIWNTTMKAEIIDHMRRDAEFRGSWDPVGKWGEAAGRTVVTALFTMCMETYYRYGKVFGSAGGAGNAPSPQWSREEYDHIEGNRFRDPRKHPLSTFSIDVDTASYANVRRLLREGSPPPAGAVRIEEMINYFTYDYPEPEKDQPFSVTTEIAECPWKPEHRLLHVGLKARSIPDTDLPPRNLVFLLDVSGSMSPSDKLPLVLRAMKLLVRTLTEKDHVAIVVYASATGVILEPTCGDRKQAIEDALGRLSAGGSTNGGEGIQRAYDLAARHFERGAVNRVILATDGDFNVGISDRSSLVRLIEKKRKVGIFLSVLGVGTGNLKDSSMEALADHGNGNYSYLDSIDEARKVLVTEAGGTLVTIAKDVKIQVEFNPRRVGSYRLIGYENRMLETEDFDDDEKDAGEIGAGHTVTALYEITPPAHVDPAGAGDALKYQDPRGLSGAAFGDEIVTVKLRYQEPDGEKSRLVSIPVTDPGNVSASSASKSFRFAAAVAGFGLLLRESEHRGNVSTAMVRELAHSALGEDPFGYRRGFLELLRLLEEGD